MGKNTQFLVRLPGGSRSEHKHRVRKTNSSKMQSEKKLEAVRGKSCPNREQRLKMSCTFCLVAVWRNGSCSPSPQHGNRLKVIQEKLGTPGVRSCQVFAGQIKRNHSLNMIKNCNQYLRNHFCACSSFRDVVVNKALWLWHWHLTWENTWYHANENRGQNSSHLGISWYITAQIRCIFYCIPCLHHGKMSLCSSQWSAKVLIESYGYFACKFNKRKDKDN